MFAFAKQLVRSAEDILSQNTGLPPTVYNEALLPHNNNSQTDANGAGARRKEDPEHGFRVLFVRDSSTAKEAGVESVFDYVVGVGGVDIDERVEMEQKRLQQEQLEQEQADSGLSMLNDKQAINNPANSALPVSQLPPPPPPPPTGAAPPRQRPQHQHKRQASSISFASAGLILPQLMPPEPVLAPIDVFKDALRENATSNSSNGGSGMVELDLWSAKGRVRRTVMLPYSISEKGLDATGDSSLDSTTSSLLGLTLQWTPLSVADHVWHILNVSPNSPAEAAGLLPHSDYIVGAEQGLLAAGGEDLLGRVVQRVVLNHTQMRRQVFMAQAHAQAGGGHVSQGAGAVAGAEGGAAAPAEAEVAEEIEGGEGVKMVNSVAELELLVYNHDYNVLRAVRIRPNSRWGGSGLLGCGIGYGLLHRLPALPVVPGAINHELQEEAGFVTGIGGGHNPKTPTSATAMRFPPGGLVFDLSMEKGIAEEDEDEEQGQDADDETEHEDDEKEVLTETPVTPTR